MFQNSPVVRGTRLVKAAAVALEVRGTRLIRAAAVALGVHRTGLIKAAAVALEVHRTRLVKAAAVAFAIAMVSTAWLAYDILAGLPGRRDLRSLGDMPQATMLYDVADRPVFALFKEQRIEVPLARISPHLVAAVVAIEDRRFYNHRGLDGVRVVGAAWNNLLERRVAQGGSTITQQLARQSFLTSDKTLRRKLKEAVLAARIEGLYSKGEILELYLNKVYFGDGLYGAEAASRGYFGTAAVDLDIPEAALLAGLVRSPSNYSPTVNVERSMARRNVVLQAMLDQGVIDRDTWRRASGVRVRLRNASSTQEASGLYFKEEVRQELVERFGAQAVYEGGLRVYTTIDPAMQGAAEAAVARSLSEIEARKSTSQRRGTTSLSGASAVDTPSLEAAVVAIDPRTGEVRAMVGGRDFAASRFNRVRQAKRQPGSAFKPFVYAAALEAGYSPATVIANLDEPILTPQGGWVPEDGHSTAPQMTMRTALRTSSNRAAVRMLQEVGIPPTISYAQRLGIGSLPSVPSLALGSGEVTLLSMTMAYAAFADQGFLHRPILIRRVVDANGTTLFQASAWRERAMTETTAFLMSHMLADVMNAGTGSNARRMGFSLPAAGKTGTTNNYNDAWFIGFTPSLVAGVWLGFDQPHTIVRNGYAADLAVPLWTRFMKVATRNDPPAAWFSPPAGIIAANVCRVSGKLPAGGCNEVEVVDDRGIVTQRSMVYSEYFARGTEPHDTCPLHPSRSFLTAMAGVFGIGGGERAPTNPEAAGVPADAQMPDAVATTAHSDEAAAPPEPPKKKRGFWSRVFGIGKDRKD